METHQQINHHSTQISISYDQHIQENDQGNNIGAAGVVGINSNNKSMSSTGNGNGNSYVCSRQSSTRWTPTTDQIRILKDLYYNNGVRSPTADQIQRISARLRQYGKIEGKNVFYWFQNHKARERQKKRFTNDHIMIPPPPPMNINFTPIQTSPPPLRPPHPNSNSHHIYNNNNHNHQKPLYPNYLSPAGVPCSSTSCKSPAGVLGVGQNNGSCANYGSVAMEKSFRDCSISQGETQNCGWVGHVDPYSTSTYHSFLDKRNPFELNQETLDDDHNEDDEDSPEIETLPLFPMHGDINDYNTSNGFFKPDHSSSGYGYFTGSWYRSDDYAAATNVAGSRASLELSLNSYTGWSINGSS